MPSLLPYNLNPLCSAVSTAQQALSHSLLCRTLSSLSCKDLEGLVVSILEVKGGRIICKPMSYIAFNTQLALNTHVIDSSMDLFVHDGENGGNEFGACTPEAQLTFTNV